MIQFPGELALTLAPLPFSLGFLAWGAHAPSRAAVGASPAANSDYRQAAIGGGADGHTRGACAPRARKLPRLTKWQCSLSLSPRCRGARGRHRTRSEECAKNEMRPRA